MSNEILQIYDKILEIALLIKQSIDKEEWEHVNLLTSQREELVQKSNAFVFGKIPITENLKPLVKEKLLAIKQVDDENISRLEQNRDQLHKAMKKVSKGQKLISAYQSVPTDFKGSYDART